MLLQDHTRELGKNRNLETLAQPALVATSDKLPAGSEPQPGGLEASTEETVEVGNE